LQASSEFFRAQQCGQGRRHIVQQTFGLGFGGTFALLMVLPSDCLRVRVSYRIAAGDENMRVSGQHLGRNGFDHVAEYEQACFFGHARVVDGLQQQIAEFLLQTVPVLILDGSGDFVGFLDRVRRDARERLFAVPGAAAVRIAQAAHDLDQVGDVAGRFQLGHGPAQLHIQPSRRQRDNARKRRLCRSRPSSQFRISNIMGNYRAMWTNRPARCTRPNSRHAMAESLLTEAPRLSYGLTLAVWNCRSRRAARKDYAFDIARPDKPTAAVAIHERIQIFLL